MKRSKNVDLYRGAALLLVFMYHVWVLIGSNPGWGEGIAYFNFGFPIIRYILALGGELGVTMFFLLSGYGIYASLLSKPVVDGKSYWQYLKRRFLRVAPQYYISNQQGRTAEYDQRWS